MGTKKQICG